MPTPYLKILIPYYSTKEVCTGYYDRLNDRFIVYYLEKYAIALKNEEVKYWREMPSYPNEINE